jgi:hypothetical protein
MKDQNNTLRCQVYQLNYQVTVIKRVMMKEKPNTTLLYALKLILKNIVSTKPWPVFVGKCKICNVHFADVRIGFTPTKHGSAFTWQNDIMWHQVDLPITYGKNNKVNIRYATYVPYRIQIVEDFIEFAFTDNGISFIYRYLRCSISKYVYYDAFNKPIHIIMEY